MTDLLQEFKELKVLCEDAPDGIEFGYDDSGPYPEAVSLRFYVAARKWMPILIGMVQNKDFDWTEDYLVIKCPDCGKTQYIQTDGWYEDGEVQCWSCNEWNCKVLAEEDEARMYAAIHAAMQRPGVQKMWEADDENAG